MKRDENISLQEITRVRNQPARTEQTAPAQTMLPFDVSASVAPAPEAVVPVPRKYGDKIDGEIRILTDSYNPEWVRWTGQVLAGVLIRTHDDYVEGLAKANGKSGSWLRGLRSIFEKGGRNWAAFAKARIPKARPGRSSHTFFNREGNGWKRDRLYNYFLNQSGHKANKAWQLLLADIDVQTALGQDKGERPTLDQCRTALKKIPKPVRVLARQGEKAFNDQCSMYLSRDPRTLLSNDLWVTDQKQVDVRLRDGGERLGRIWIVNFLDVASDKVLGFAFGPVLSSDLVMMAATMAIGRFGVPRAVHMDLGKEFICTAFNGKMRKLSGEVLFREALGLWKSLGIEPVKAIGRNPQSKTIERYHANLPDFDRCFPGYCGSSPDTRPEKLKDEEAQHEDWKKGRAERSPLVTISQYILAYANWAEKEWNAAARGRGKMRQGMTPNEAYNVKRPADGFRTISAPELDHHSAEHRFVKIGRGGQVNLTFYGQTVEYLAPELFLHQGEDCEAIISRRTFRQITVIFPVTGGTASCVATLKPQLAWLPENREELRAAMRCKAAVHRAIRQGAKASRIALEAANPVALLEQQKALPAKDIIGAQKFFGPSAPEPGYPEMSGVEYQATRPKRANWSRSQTSAEAARRILEMKD